MYVDRAPRSRAGGSRILTVSRIVEALSTWQRRRPDAVALQGNGFSVSYAELADRVSRTADALRERGCRHAALLADNGVDWVVADLAALSADVTLVPLPPFFSNGQLTHLLESAPIDTILTDAPARIARLSAAFTVDTLPSVGLTMLRQAVPAGAGQPARNPVAKITFTSGSTGTPKGVCLARIGIEQTAEALATTLGNLGTKTHLCILPLAMLLENIAGVYAPLLLGASIQVPPLASVGLKGSSGINVETLRAAVDRAGAESVILTPQLLAELTASASRTPWTGCTLRFVAVGGAKLSDEDIEDAHAAGIPAYQGYGLSECNSVVALNRPGAYRRGSVGRALPGVGFRIASDGEIFVSGSRMLGYLGENPVIGDEIATGDLGHLDDDCYLYVTGRKKNVFITSFGRNVSPEWPEAELVHQPEIAQAVVYGEGRPTNTAIIVPASTGIGPRLLAGAVSRANRNLPDYAHIGEWVVADEPFTTANGQLTPTGKPRREAVIHHYILEAAPTALRA